MNTELKNWTDDMWHHQLTNVMGFEYKDDPEKFNFYKAYYLQLEAQQKKNDSPDKQIVCKHKDQEWKVSVFYDCDPIESMEIGMNHIYKREYFFEPDEEVPNINSLIEWIKNTNLKVYKDLKEEYLPIIESILKEEDQKFKECYEFTIYVSHYSEPNTIHLKFYVQDEEENIA